MPPDDQATTFSASPVEVARFSSLSAAQEHTLVILAMNLDCWIRLEAESGQAILLADPAFEGAIREELALYDEEEAARRRLAASRPADSPAREARWELAILWAATLVMVYLFQTKDAGLAVRFANDNLAVTGSGEWWRPFTALFLHADPGHLLGNLLVGGVFCLLVAPTLGPWRGWFLILLTGTLGNLATGLVRLPDLHRSLGASTATFGALGLLVGHGLRQAWAARSTRGLRALIAPLAVGMIFLGWFGAGGPDTDVLAHLLGCAFGVALGAFIPAGRASASPGERANGYAARR